MQQNPIIPQPRPPAPDFRPRPSPPGHPGRRDNARSILSTLAILIAAPIVALFLTAFVFQSYQVDGPSMETTLQNGDRLIVLKTGKTWASLLNNDYIPKRGEIIVFHRDDSQNGPGSDRQLIKRVIGLPGDRVVVRGGDVTVYNDDFPGGFNPDKAGGYESNVAATTPGNVDITVPAGEVFVSGDNRTNSHDSRYFGTIASEDIVGSLILRIYPFNKVDAF